MNMINEHDGLAHLLLTPAPEAPACLHLTLSPALRLGWCQRCACVLLSISVDPAPVDMPRGFGMRVFLECRWILGRDAAFMLLQHQHCEPWVF